MVTPEHVTPPLMVNCIKTDSLVALTVKVLNMVSGCAFDLYGKKSKKSKKYKELRFVPGFLWVLGNMIEVGS
jgi:glucose uptake protein GlcU